jgi:hypothetical protein
MRLLLCFHKLQYESTLQYTDEEGHGQPPGCLKHQLGLKGNDPFKKKDNMIIYVNLLKQCWKNSMREETKLGVIIDFSIKTTRSKLEVPRQHTLHILFPTTICHGYTYLIPSSLLDEILAFPTHELNLVPVKIENTGLISLTLGPSTCFRLRKSNMAKNI